MTTTKHCRWTIEGIDVNGEQSFPELPASVQEQGIGYVDFWLYFTEYEQVEQAEEDFSRFWKGARHADKVIIRIYDEFGVVKEKRTLTNVALSIPPERIINLLDGIIVCYNLRFEECIYIQGPMAER